MLYTPDTLRSVGLNPDGMTFCGKFPPYDSALVGLASELRNYGTKSEAYMWQMLKHSKLGYKFSRQKPIYRYIADFYCHELSLVVEIDGASHNNADAQGYDRQRDLDMMALGLRVVRIADSDVLRFPIASAQKIFLDIGVPVPEVINQFADGSERLWPVGFLGRY